jgi:hypothetical protein
MRDNYYEKAIIKLEKHCMSAQGLDQRNRGWLWQIAARVAHYWGNDLMAQQLQQNAYGDNPNLLRPRVAQPYMLLTQPGPQAEAIVARIEEFGTRRGYVAEFDEVVSHLVREASSNQFEQSLADLGAILGFVTERPDNKYGKGPDVLWLLTSSLALVIEAKSRKSGANPLTKEQHGQLLNADEWFKSEYHNYESIRVSMHPNTKTTDSNVPGATMALTYDKLNELVAAVRKMIVELCESVATTQELVMRSERLLHKLNLSPEEIIRGYLLPFEGERLS